MDKVILYIPFLLFIGGKTMLVSKATEAFYKFIGGFTCMYTDIFQQIDSASLRYWMIHCGGEVFEEFSSTFLLIFVVSCGSAFRFSLLMFPLASGAKDIEQVLKPCTTVRFFLHSLKVVPTFH